MKIGFTRTASRFTPIVLAAAPRVRHLRRRRGRLQYEFMWVDDIEPSPGTAESHALCNAFLEGLRGNAQNAWSQWVAPGCCVGGFSIPLPEPRTP